MDKKTCPECGERFVGRGDKKFCSVECRNHHHNTLNRDSNNLIRNINNQLRRNRRILKTFNPNGKGKVSKDELLMNGFNFRYYTSTYTTKQGATYYFVYDQGYLPLEGEKFALVRKKEYA